jgi:hypothetical protein
VTSRGSPVFVQGLIGVARKGHVNGQLWPPIALAAFSFVNYLHLYPTLLCILQLLRRRSSQVLLVPGDSSEIISLFSHSRYCVASARSRPSLVKKGINQFQGAR